MDVYEVIQRFRAQFCRYSYFSIIVAYNISLLVYPQHPAHTVGDAADAPDTAMRAFYIDSFASVFAINTATLSIHH